MSAKNYDDDFTQNSLDLRKIHRTYLITCSQVDRERFPTRESFGRVIYSWLF